MPYNGIFVLSGGDMDMHSLESPLKESRHGTQDFPLAVYRSRPSLRRCALYSHWHDEAEFFLLNHGKLSFFLNGRAFGLEAGQALFVGPGEVHAALAADASPVSFTAVVFSLDMLASDFLGDCGESLWAPFLRGSLVPAQRVFSRSTDLGASVIDSIESIAKDSGSSAPGHELAILASLYSAFSAIVGQAGMIEPEADGPNRGSSRLRSLKNALRYIQENAGREIGVREIAGQAHMSQYHFSRFFKRMTGSSPIEYLLRLRIERAERLLSGTDGKVGDIAEAVGFRSASHFIKTFKRHKGLTPAAFRRESRGVRP